MRRDVARATGRPSPTACFPTSSSLRTLSSMNVLPRSTFIVPAAFLLLLLAQASGQEAVDGHHPSLFYRELGRRTPAPTRAPTRAPTTAPTRAPTRAPTPPPTPRPTSPRIVGDVCDPGTWIMDMNDAEAYTVGLTGPQWTGEVYRLGNTTLAQCCEYCRTSTYCQVWTHNQVNSTNSYCTLAWPIPGGVTTQCPAGQLQIVGIYGNGTTPFSLGFSSPCAINDVTLAA